MYLVFTRMLGESYRRQLRSLLLCACYVFICYVFPVLIICYGFFVSLSSQKTEKQKQNIVQQQQHMPHKFNCARVDKH